MKAKHRALGDHPDHPDHHKPAADPPELARALWLVRRLAEAPVATAEIDAARERVRARVFAVIAAPPSPGPLAAAALRPLARHRAE